MKTKKLAGAALLLALGWLLPLLTGQIPSVGNMLCPMHVPAMIGGFVLGPLWGMLLGFIMPVTRSLIFGMPVMFPGALAMAFELAAYAFCCGIFYRRLSLKRGAKIYVSLVLAMIIGRVVWGAAQTLLLGLKGSSFTFGMFVTSGLLNAWPGILLQLIIIPPVIAALERAKLID